MGLTKLIVYVCVTLCALVMCWSLPSVHLVNSTKSTIQSSGLLSNSLTAVLHDVKRSVSSVTVDKDKDKGARTKKRKQRQGRKRDRRHRRGGRRNTSKKITELWLEGTNHSEALNREFSTGAKLDIWKDHKPLPKWANRLVNSSLIIMRKGLYQISTKVMFELETQKDYKDSNMYTLVIKDHERGITRKPMSCTGPNLIGESSGKFLYGCYMDYFTELKKRDRVSIVNSYGRVFKKIAKGPHRHYFFMRKLL